MAGLSGPTRAQDGSTGGFSDRHKAHTILSMSVGATTLATVGSSTLGRGAEDHEKPQLKASSLNLDYNRDPPLVEPYHPYSP